MATKDNKGIRSFVRRAYQGLKANWSSGGWNGVDVPIWSPDHPLNRATVFAGSGIMADRERIENDFEGYVMGAFKADGPVFACAQARQFVFSEAEFCFKNKSSGKLYGSPALALLEQGYEGNAAALLARIDQDVTCAGNSWWTICNDQGDFGKAALRRGTGQRLAHMRPDWVTMVIGSATDDPRALDAHLVGIIFQPLANGQGFNSGGPAPKILLTADEVAHIAPVPDPVARFRGISWITPVVKHIEADKAATTHKGAFISNAAVPNLAIKFSDETSEDDIAEFQERFASSQAGQFNAGKTLFLLGGADPVALTHSFKDMDFSNVVGKGESSIAAAAGVPPSWVGFSEGMQGSALNTGNLAANRRRFADGTIRPLWRHTVNALACLVEVPADSVLWWKEDGIAFLREDQTDRSAIMQHDSASVETLIRAGYEPDATILSVDAKDMTLLIGKHTGLVSVQMQPPVDPSSKLDRSLDEAKILQTMAQAVQTFVTAGYTHESSIAAVDANDLTLLVKDTSIEPWSPTGTALRVPGSGADNGTPQPNPDAAGPPGAAPSSTPTGSATRPAGKPTQTQPKGGGNAA